MEFNRIGYHVGAEAVRGESKAFENSVLLVENDIRYRLRFTVNDMVKR